MRIALMAMTVLAIASPLMAAKHAITIDDLLAVKSVSDPQVSPDGKLVAYVVSEIDRAANKSNSDLWLVSTAGGTPKRLTTAPGADNHPRWSPNGKTIAFVSNRSGSSQIWLLSMDGGEATQLTKLPIDLDGPIWSPKGDKIAFVASVIPGKTPEETAKSEKEKSEAKSKARVYDSLMIRHWASWDEGTRSHLFVADAKTGEAKDLIPSWTANVPPGPFGGSSDYAWSNDGEELAFTSEPLKDHAWSTNTDIWTVAASGGEPKNQTERNPGADAQPSYLPDHPGILSFVSQERAGFEADRWVLQVRTTGAWGAISTPITGSLDRPVQSFVATSDRAEMGFLAVIDDQGTEPIIRIKIDGPMVISSGTVVYQTKDLKVDRDFITGGVNTSVSATPDGKGIAFLRASAAAPNEVYTVKPDGSGLTQLTHHNDELLAKLDLAKAEGFTFSGADGDEVHGWLIKPPGFDPNKKYPVLFAIHGGPQGAWHDEWSARWNYQMFASPGYAVVAINPRGSTGYGQKFTDQISTDWNGRVYEDLFKGLDHALKTYSFLDGDRVAAAGGSYGGYMVNWIAGHTDRFKALISHAGVFDLTSKYGTTEELWFPDWEFGGPPWKDEATTKRYREQSPSTYVPEFKTPTLVIHGALDFRVPEAQGLGMFTALQRRGVPSRYLYFPDEGHWILKAGNREVWWKEMHGWLAKYLK